MSEADLMLLLSSGYIARKETYAKVYVCTMKLNEYLLYKYLLLFQNRVSCFPDLINLPYRNLDIFLRRLDFVKLISK